MKTNLIISVREARMLLANAKADSIKRYGKVVNKATLCINFDMVDASHLHTRRATEVLTGNNPFTVSSPATKGLHY